jgi:hypothetical protein
MCKAFDFSVTPMPGMNENQLCADEACLHSWCARWRAVVDAECRECGEPIGYGVGYYYNNIVDDEDGDGLAPETGYYHARCL